MKQLALLAGIVILAGCASTKPVLPSVDGKPRTKINAQAPAAETAPQQIQKDQ
jgi:uncharacterized lipoprotein YajG